MTAAVASDWPNPVTRHELESLHYLEQMLTDPPRWWPAWQQGQQWSDDQIRKQCEDIKDQMQWLWQGDHWYSWAKEWDKLRWRRQVLKLRASRQQHGKKPR